MIIRNVTNNDAAKLYHMMNVLDDETDFMMYEPGERKKAPHAFERLAESVEAAVSGGDFMAVAQNDRDEIVGFVSARRGRPNRVRHTAYVVIGVLPAYRGQGVGGQLMRRLDLWAEQNGVVRLELTVEAPNTVAKRLYEKNGFKVEGVRYGSMRVKGAFVDEYYMAKIIR